MFKNGKSNTETPAIDVTVINRGTTVEGEIRVAGTIRIYGRLNGTLRSEGRVIVAEDGVLNGDLYADTADVSGRVEGVIEAERLDLRSTATVEGNVVVKKFTTETGAVFVGDCKMPQNGPLPSTTASGAEAAPDEKDATDDEAAASAKQGKAEGDATEEKPTPAASIVENGVKPIPNKPADAAQPESVDAADADDEGTRPRFW